MLKEALKEPGAFSKVIAISPATRGDPVGGPSAPSPAPKLDLQRVQAAGPGGRVSSSRRSRSVDEIGLNMGPGVGGRLWEGAAGHQTWHNRPESKAMVQEPETKPRERANKRFYAGMNASTSNVVFDEDHAAEARNPMLSCRFDDDAAGLCNLSKQTRLASARLQTARKRTEMIRQPDAAGAPLEVAGPGRHINFLIATGTDKRHGKTKFNGEKEKRCTEEVQYRGRVHCGAPSRSQIWEIVYSREDNDTPRSASVQSAAGLPGGDKVGFNVPSITTPRRNMANHFGLPSHGLDLLHHHEGPQASPHGSTARLQRSASAPPEPGERTPPFDPYTRRGVVGCPRPMRPPARLGAFA